MRLRLALAASLLFPLAVSALAPSERSRAASPEGRWEGTLERKDARLAVAFTLKRSGKAEAPWQGTFEAADLRALGVPLSDLRIDGDRITFALVGDSSSTTFEGSWSGDDWSGSFREEAGPGAFTLRRSAPSSPPFREEAVHFRNGDVVLAGTLLLPAGAGRHPAVLFLHGSGPEGRFASRFLAEALARRGIAALIYDKRGVGESSGDWRSSDYGELAADASAGLALLKGRPEIDAAHLGVYGHSQGGFITPLVAVRSRDVAFVIAAASHGGPAFEQDLYRVGNALATAPFSPQDRERAMAFYRRFVEVARTGEGQGALLAEAESLKSEPWLQWLAIPPAEHWLWSFYRKTGSYDSLPWWRQVTVPVLLLYGERDALIPVAESAARIEAALRAAGSSRFAVVLLPRASHPLTVEPPPERPYDWPRLAAGLPDLLASWVLYQARKP